MESEIKALEVAVVIPGTMAIRDVPKQILPYHIIEMEMNGLKDVSEHYIRRVTLNAKVDKP